MIVPSSVFEDAVMGVLPCASTPAEGFAQGLTKGEEGVGNGSAATGDGAYQVPCLHPGRLAACCLPRPPRRPGRYAPTQASQAGVGRGANVWRCRPCGRSVAAAASSYLDQVWLRERPPPCLPPSQPALRPCPLPRAAAASAAGGAAARESGPRLCPGGTQRGG